MIKGLITLGKTFYEAYPQLGENIKSMGIELTEIISDEPVSKEIILRNIQDVEIYIVGVEKVDKEILDAARKLKYIAKHGAGIDNIDLSYAAKKNIIVTYTPGQNSSSVADMTFALILAISRKIIESNEVVKNGGWKLFMGSELEEKILGIIGFGSIGKKVAQRAKGFGMKVVTYDIYQDIDFAKKIGVEFVDLETLLKISDYVSINTSLNNSTFGMIDKEKLRKMKKTAYLINTARGQIVVEKDLIEALQEGYIKGAALDVYNSEPPNPELVKLSNVIATSHIGGSTYECAERLGRITLNNIRKFLNGEKLDYVAVPTVN